MTSQWRSFKYFSTKISEILCQMCMFKTIKSLNEIFYFLYEQRYEKKIVENRLSFPRVNPCNPLLQKIFDPLVQKKSANKILIFFVWSKTVLIFILKSTYFLVR